MAFWLIQAPGWLLVAYLAIAKGLAALGVTVYWPLLSLFTVARAKCVGLEPCKGTPLLDRAALDRALGAGGLIHLCLSP